VTPDDFRRIALSHPGAVEFGHMGKPDFRVAGRVFATLGFPGPDFGMVKLDPEQQALLLQAEPAVFSPANGAWGRAGCTLLRLDAADAATLASAIGMAFAQAVSASAIKKGRRGRRPSETSSASEA
jgi:hypothetical protein